VSEGFYDPWSLLSSPEMPTGIIYSTACPQPATASAAKLQSQARALAVHIDIAPSESTRKMCLQGAQQAIFFTLPAQASENWGAAQSCNRRRCRPLGFIRSALNELRRY
jgi:hypothetical protein